MNDKDKQSCPATEVLHRHPLKLPKDGWKELDESYGLTAQTWTTPDYILQYHTPENLMRELTSAPITTKINLLGCKVRSSIIFIKKSSEEKLVKYNIKKVKSEDILMYRDELESIEGYWSVQKRIKGTSYNMRINSEETIDEYLDATPAIIKELEVLANFKGVYDLRYSIPHRRTVVRKNMGAAATMVLADEFNKRIRKAWKDFPFEKSSEIVLTHGDPVIKNTIKSADGKYHLIDWNTISRLEKHRDYIHGATYICKNLPVDKWSKLLSKSWELHKEHLPSWEYEDWKVSFGWGILSSYLVVPPDHLNKKEIIDLLVKFPKTINEL